jgi:hypothetical protein
VTCGSLCNKYAAQGVRTEEKMNSL